MQIEIQIAMYNDIAVEIISTTKLNATTHDLPCTHTYQGNKQSGLVSHMQEVFSHATLWSMMA